MRAGAVITTCFDGERQPRAKLQAIAKFGFVGAGPMVVQVCVEGRPVKDDIPHLVALWMDETQARAFASSLADSILEAFGEVES